MFAGETELTPPGKGVERKSLWILLAVVAATASLLFAFRLGAPCDLMDFGQEAPMAYTLDAIHHHHWLVQWDNDGSITSKPPFHTWIAAGFSFLIGRVNELTLALPSGIATFGIALVLFFAGRRVFGERAGFISALIFLLSAAAFKAVVLVRVDTVFTLMVAVTALLVFRAWQQGNGWTVAWVSAAFAILTKGPLGLALAFAGLLGAVWESRSGRPAPVKGSHWRGMLLFFAMAGGWFLLALGSAGQQLIDKMFFRELVHHAITNGENDGLGQHFYYPSLYFLSRFAPWSLFACLGFWRTVKHPAENATERRFERFLFCWFLVGLLVFSATPHQRGDLLWPIYPPAALLAARELARLLRPWSWVRIGAAAAAAALIFFTAGSWVYYKARPGREALAQTQAVIEFSKSLRPTLQRLAIVPTYVRTSSLLQMRLSSAVTNVSFQAAADLMRQKTPVFLIVPDLAPLRRWLGNQAPVYVLLEGPRTRLSHIQLVSNQPRVELTGKE